MSDQIKDDISSKKKKSSFSSFVSKMDDKVPEKTGKRIFLTFKWLTMLIFFIGIPLFTLIYTFSILEDGFTFETQMVQKEAFHGEEINSVHTISRTFTYEDIDISLEKVYDNKDLKNTIFIDTVINSNVDESKVTKKSTDLYFFYSVFTAKEFSNNEYKVSDYINYEESPIDDKDFWSEDYKINPQNLITEYIYKNSVGWNKDTQKVENSSDAKKAFRDMFPPKVFVKSDSNVRQNGVTIGWILIGIGTLTFILMVWFSKWSKVPLKEKNKGEKK